jgi:hypothetical protein
MAHKIEEAPRIVEVPHRLDTIISQAVWEFAQENPPWEAHIRYHDEPLWILRREDEGVVQRIQVAFFAEPEGPVLRVIPDRSDLKADARVKFRRDGQTIVLYKELLAYDTKELKSTLRSAAVSFGKYPI